MPKNTEVKPETKTNPSAFFKISYGLFVLTTKDGDKDNGCIINTTQLLTTSPEQITIAVNKQNYTNDIILRTKKFNVSILTEEAQFDLFKRFGFQSGKNTNKFADDTNFKRSENGLYYLTKDCNAFISATVENAVDCGTHTLFIAKVDEAKTLSDAPSVTYDYYFKHIKPKPATIETHKSGWVCQICNYFYEGENIPDDYICPLCKHGVQDFKFVK